MEFGRRFMFLWHGQPARADGRAWAGSPCHGHASQICVHPRECAVPTLAWRRDAAAFGLPPLDRIALSATLSPGPRDGEKFRSWLLCPYGARAGRKALGFE